MMQEKVSHQIHQHQHGESTVFCVGSMGKDIFLPTNEGVVGKATKGIKTNKQWAFGYGSKIHIEDRFQAPGGCACNVSVGLQRLTIDAKAYGLTGEDADGKWIASELASAGVDVQYIQTAQESITDSSMILVHTPSGERTIFVNRDVGEHFILQSSILQEAPWLFIGSLYGTMIRENMSTIHDVLTTSSTKLLYNPGMRNIQMQPRTVCDLIHHASILFVNKVEAKAIVQELTTGYNGDELEQESFLLDALWKQAKPDTTVVLTAGSLGAWAKNKNEQLYIQIKEREIIDTTGAGDAFASGFAAAHIFGLNLKQCLQWGGANSHNVIGYYGAHKGLLYKSELETKSKAFHVSNY